MELDHRWKDYKRSRKLLGMTASPHNRLEKCSPETTFKLSRATLNGAIKHAWLLSLERMSTVPAYMKPEGVFYDIIFEVFGISKPDLLRDNRDAVVSNARGVMIMLMHAHGMAPGRIRRLVHKDYATCAHAIKKFKWRFEEATGVETYRDRRLASDGQTERSVPSSVHGRADADSAEAQA